MGAERPLDRAEGVTVFYPFPGPDLPWAAFDQGLQRPLAAAYRAGAGVKPLAFRLGYEKDSGSSLQVATKSGSTGAPPRNCGPS